MNNHATAETQQFVEALRKLRHNPDMVFSIMVPGDIPISCRMQRFDPGPPPDAEAGLQLPAEVTPPVVKPGGTSEPKKPGEPAKPPAATQQPTSPPKKTAEPPQDPAKPAPE